MSNLVYSHTNEYRETVKDIESRAPLDHKLSVWSQPGKVSITHSVLICGRPNHQEVNKDKRWYKWRTIESYGFRCDSRNITTGYRSSRPWSGKVGDPWKGMSAALPFDILTGEEDIEQFPGIADAFRQNLLLRLDIRNMGDIYPIAEEYNIWRYKYIPFNIKSAMRSKDFVEFTARVFGKSRATHQMVSAVRQADPLFVDIAHQARGIVDDKSLINYMYDNKIDDELSEKLGRDSAYGRQSTICLRPVFLKVSNKSVENLLSNDVHVNYEHMLNIGYTKAQSERFAWNLKSDKEYKSWASLRGL